MGGGGGRGREERGSYEKMIRWEAAQFYSEDAKLSHPKKFSSWWLRLYAAPLAVLHPP